MKRDKHTSGEAAGLRRRAEARPKALATKSAPARTEADTQRLVHELQVHQVELEMQNEELRQTRAEAEAGLERYAELYDFAPAGYLALGRDGVSVAACLVGYWPVHSDRRLQERGRLGKTETAIVMRRNNQSPAWFSPLTVSMTCFTAK